MDFLGHKRALLDFIFAKIREASGDIRGPVADLFSGSGAVATAFKKRGFQVLANDQLYWCALLSEAQLLNDGHPRFSRLIKSAPRVFSGPNPPYERVLALLEKLHGRKGFIYRSYSPASVRFGSPARMYFTEANAARIDGIRAQIEEWRPLLERGEFALLVSTLVMAATECSNIAGTFGCYLKHWKPRSLAALRLKPLEVSCTGTSGHEVYSEDAQTLVSRVRVAVAYADPPYTKRQYAAYYHVLETIALFDEPLLLGSTGLRPWKEKSSPYCFRRKAPLALEQLVSRLNCGHFFLSYNEDGQIPHQGILEILGRYGVARTFETRSRRYKSSSLPHKGNSVIERLYHLRLAN